ncbi:MAG: rhodanese-like domain-containing protein [Panacagrimonas sp.]
MRPIALSRNWLLILGSALVFWAVALRSGGPELGARDVSMQEAIALVDAGALVIDVRDSASTHLPGALLIPLEVLAARLPSLETARTQQIVVYCGNGTYRGPQAVQILTDAGFSAVNMKAGIEGWRDARLPVVSS